MRPKTLLARTTSLSSLAALLLLTPLLGGARGCGGDDTVPIGMHDAGPPAECAVTECGPPLGAPAILCEDGSIGGNTGLCVRDATTGTCGWELRECPTAMGCGGDTITPSTPCPDGFYCAYAPEAICGAADAPGTCRAVPDACPAIYGPVCGCDGVTYDNECVAAAARTSVLRGGACETTPPGECAPGECGPALGAPAILCEDGSIGGNTGRCLRDPATRTCGWELRDCPPPGPGACTDAECGPAPLSPTILCPDGSTGGNLNLCSRDPSTGTCGWQFRDCPTTTSCGGFVPPGTSSTCAAGYYCAYDITAMCGAADAPGTCMVIPEACATIYAPVCGCNGMTYENECTAAGNGTGVMHTGPCI